MFICVTMPPITTVIQKVTTWPGPVGLQCHTKQNLYKAEIGGSHFEKLSPFCFDWHCHVRIDITGFLIYDSTYLVTKIMILSK